MSPKESGRSEGLHEERYLFRNPYLAKASRLFDAIAVERPLQVRTKQQAVLDFRATDGTPCSARLSRQKAFFHNDWQIFELTMTGKNEPSNTSLFIDTDNQIKRYSGKYPLSNYSFFINAPVSDDDHLTIEDIIRDINPPSQSYSTDSDLSTMHITVPSDDEIVTQLYEINAGMEEPLIPVEEFPLARPSIYQSQESFTLYKRFFGDVKTYYQTTRMKFAKDNNVFTLIRVTDPEAKPSSLKFSRYEWLKTEDGLLKHTYEDWVYDNKLGDNSYSRKDGVTLAYGKILTDELLKKIRAVNVRTTEQDTEQIDDPESRIREIRRD